MGPRAAGEVEQHQLLCLTDPWSQSRGRAQGTEMHLLSQVFDGAVIILSLAPMVASTVANGPRSPWDAISLIIMLRIWRVKRVIDGEWPEGDVVSGAASETGAVN